MLRDGLGKCPTPPLHVDRYPVEKGILFTLDHPAMKKPPPSRQGLWNWRQGSSHLSVLQPEPSDMHHASPM